MTRPKRRRAKRVSRRTAEGEDRGKLVEVLDDRIAHTDTSPVLTGGDVDADWQGASAAGDEAVGGSTATPDQDIVDEIGSALGVDRAEEEELTTSEEILRARDRRRWEIEAEAEGEADTEEP
jgi:hypothetical protein